jgi:ferritin-like metal-binding protein YciE
MKLSTLTDLYIDQLQDMHSAEKQLTRALPKMARAAASEELKAALSEHLEVTKEQLSRLDTILSGLDKTAGRKVCEAAVGLVAEGSEIIDADGEEDIRDAGLIVAAQKVEHYEIASYGSLRAFALLLGRRADARLLEQTLSEEKEADATLTKLSTNINARAKP